MGQDDVLAAFRSASDKLTRAEIVKRCQHTGCADGTIGAAITAARKAGRINVVGKTHNGRFLYMLVV